MAQRIVGIAGSASVPSRTRALVAEAVDIGALRFGAVGSVFDLGDLQPSLGQATVLAELDAKARAVVEAILTADALVVGSPVYKGSYTGLFKHLFDLVDLAALADKPVLLTATGGGEKHALVIEHQLRPLFGFFEAVSLPTGIYASSTDFADGLPTSPALLERLRRAVDQFAPWIAIERSPASAHREALHA